MQGMGEPLNNYDEVSSAVKMMVDPQIFALRRSAVTVSTVGVIPRMLQMVEDLPGVSLALSLHAPTQELRKTIVPSAKSYPLEKLMAAVDKYQMQTRQKVRNLLSLFASGFWVAAAHVHQAGCSHLAAAKPSSIALLCAYSLSPCVDCSFCCMRGNDVCMICLSEKLCRYLLGNQISMLCLLLYWRVHAFNES